jgi:5'-methylthioadenosine phosphorylase
MNSSGPKGIRTQIRNNLSIGVIGGSGLETFSELKILEKVRVETPYGDPSEDPLIAEHEGRKFVFLPRHGSDHRLPPHRIPYRANLYVLKQLGVRTVVSTCIVGSLKRKVKPGQFVVPDQFVNLTWGRDEDVRGSSFMHLPMAEPYCKKTRKKAIAALRSVGATAHPVGTVVVIQGPRFSTIAESRFFIRSGWDIVNMTQYPECYIAREFGLCYASIASVTDWDVGIRSRIRMEISDMDRVLEVFRRNVEMTKKAVMNLVGQLTASECSCAATTITEYYKRQ